MSLEEIRKSISALWDLSQPWVPIESFDEDPFNKKLYPKGITRYDYVRVAYSDKSTTGEIPIKAIVIEWNSSLITSYQPCPIIEQFLQTLMNKE